MSNQPATPLPAAFGRFFVEMRQVMTGFFITSTTLSKLMRCFPSESIDFRLASRIHEAKRMHSRSILSPIRTQGRTSCRGDAQGPFRQHILSAADFRRKADGKQPKPWSRQNLLRPDNLPPLPKYKTLLLFTLPTNTCNRGRKIIPSTLRDFCYR